MTFPFMVPLRKLLDSRVVAGIVGEPLDERGVSGGFLATSGLPLFVNESVYCLVLLLRFVYTFRTFAASKISMPVFIRNVGSSFLTQSRLTDSIIYDQLSGLFRELGLVAIAVAELSSASRRNLIVIFG